MLDKTKNLFTCSVHGDSEAIRFPVCHHVRAWVKKQIADSYDKGYNNGYFTYKKELADLLDTKPHQDAFFTKGEIKRQLR